MVTAFAMHWLSLRTSKPTVSNTSFTNELSVKMNTASQVQLVSDVMSASFVKWHQRISERTLQANISTKLSCLMIDDGRGKGEWSLAKPEGHDYFPPPLLFLTKNVRKNTSLHDVSVSFYYTSHNAAVRVTSSLNRSRHGQQNNFTITLRHLLKHRRCASY